MNLSWKRSSLPLSIVTPIALVTLVACGGAQAQDVEPTVTDPSEEMAVEVEPDTQPVAEPEAEVEVEVEVVVETPDVLASVNEPWGAIVATYVTDDGGFQYEALMANTEHMALLEAAVAAVATFDPAPLSRDEQLAFYMNAYNVTVVASVIAEWPVESVLEEDGFFDGTEHTIAGSEMHLNALENDIIRAEYGEPRIHFLVNCASVGCPPLANYAFTADNLESSLASLAQAFVQAGTILDRDDETIELSEIFDWFGGDFEPVGGVRAFIAAQFEGDDAAFILDEDNDIEFFSYDWAVNAR